MPCYNPLRGVKNIPQGVAVPCGWCVGCKLERSRQMAVRCVHEASMHEASSFLTLTYSPENVPMVGSLLLKRDLPTLVVRHCQLFLKRLRERLAPVRVRFILCGEYGEKFGRPHYHALLFGFGFPDKVPLRRAYVSEFSLFDSELLSSAWRMGFCSVGSVTFESASYVAAYATKKILSNRADEANRLAGRVPEFLLMSRRPGLGASWARKFQRDLYPSDEVIVNGHSARPPRYYDELLKRDDRFVYDVLKARRVVAAEKLEKLVTRSGAVELVAPSRNGRRLAVREKVAKAKLLLKSRSLESEDHD